MYILIWASNRSDFHNALWIPVCLNFVEILQFINDDYNLFETLQFLLRFLFLQNHFSNCVARGRNASRIHDAMHHNETQIGRRMQLDMGEVA